MSSEGPEDAGTGMTPAGDVAQVAVWSQRNDTMRAMLDIMQNMHDQQGRQNLNDEMQVAAMEALTKVLESMKGKQPGEARKFALPSLRALNFTDKLTVDIVSDVAKFKQWIRRFEQRVTTQANLPGMGNKLEQFFKKIRESKQEEKTEELFAEMLKDVPGHEDMWISMSTQIQ